MRKFRKSHVLGAGLLTPALLGHPQDAGALSADAASAPQHHDSTTALAKENFFREAFRPSPAEKLKMSGDRIRLAQAKPNKQTPAGEQKSGRTTTPGTGPNSPAATKINSSSCPILPVSSTVYTAGCLTTGSSCGK